MKTRATARFWLRPSKLTALLMTLLFLVMPVLFTAVMFVADRNDSTVVVNGELVTGAEREQVVADINWAIAKSLLPLMIIGLWSLRRLLPRSPFDHFEIGPEGLARQGIFGRRRLPWEEIEDIKIRIIPTSSIPFAWMSVRQKTGEIRRFYFNGYLRIRLFSDLGKQSGEVSDWLLQLKSAYIQGNARGSLPPEPWGLIGKKVMLEESGLNPHASANRSSVIER
ncbi:PH domain-containing protein [Dongia sp.]|uniref:PH domain-containing protein n=1 Tax=Dongia sp. TaxID=1977262 RepID=UPI003752B172